VNRQATIGSGIEVPFFRPSITEAEIGEVVACLQSGWLTTGHRVKRFETNFAEIVGSPVFTVRTRLFYARREFYRKIAGHPAFAGDISAAQLSRKK